MSTREDKIKELTRKLARNVEKQKALETARQSVKVK